ncbi:MAG TPA: hypothetical protein VFD77_00675, partial [Brumimicrobium sp.]|nr:hypothetical protein [Brumimicrobium sp.]
MKKLIIGLLLLIGFNGWGQKDIVFVDNFVDFNQKFLSKLSPSVYEGKLINRASIEDITLLQLLGKDDKPHNWVNWMFLYIDIYNAYVDNSDRLTAEELYEVLGEKSFGYRYPDTSQHIRPMPEEVVHNTFALILEDVYKLKDSAELMKYAEVQNNKLVPTRKEADLYERITFKSAAVLDIYNPQGYSKGNLHLEQDFIVHSSNIKIKDISIDVGNGFTSFNRKNNIIDYAYDRDTTFAKAAVSYVKDGLSFNDTLDFILAVQSSPPINTTKSKTAYDFYYSYSQPFTSLQFDVGVIIGCGNESQVETPPPPFNQDTITLIDYKIRNLKRPIIILPPYRPNKPTEQKVTMDFYYNKYNVDGFIDEMVGKGYDIVIIRESPGDQRISTAGRLLADFITDINGYKKHNFPNEDWENIVMGFSAGGQHARYGLITLEKRHMEWGTPHHHTRLYIPVDSPHNGANVPVSMQAVFWDYANTLNPIAIGVRMALYDDASKDMLSHHISSNSIIPIGPGLQNITFLPTNRRLGLMNELANNFNHLYSHTDQRKSFPSFSRNIAVSMGRFDKGYDEEYGLGSSELLFEQNVPLNFHPGYGFRGAINTLYAAPISPSSSEMILSRFETRGNFFMPIQSVIWRRYAAGSSSPGYDQARGGHKNVFYDGLEDPWQAQFVGAVQVMRASAFGLGTKHYKKNISFMPLTSAFAIKNGNTASVLQNFNPQNEGMMFQKIGFDPLTDKSNHFGYPHLGRPNDHFNITPFEAMYADDNTYEHINPINTVDAGKEDYLDSIRVFLRDEIEGENFYLQNKTIGKNHANWLPNDYKYKAWYKADKELHIGYEVTPKTNKGDYIIEKTGDITVYAGEQIIMKPGFHSQSGSTYHAFIKSPPCTSSGM